MFNVVITAAWNIVNFVNQDSVSLFNSDIFGWFVNSGIMFHSKNILIDECVYNTTHKHQGLHYTDW